MLSYIEISKSNLIHNISEFRKILPKETKIAAVIKGNAYGHGQNIVAEILNDYVDYFQIDDFEELKLVRLNKLITKPILVLGYVSQCDIEEALKLEAILTVYDIYQIKIIDEIAKRLNINPKIQICIDSCLGRDGMLLKDLEEFVKELKNYQNIVVDGIYSHFANIEDTSDLSHARKQLEAFEKAVESFKQNRFSDVKRHLCATSGVLAGVGNGFKPFPTDIVRIGIGVYGMWPSEQLRITNDELQIEENKIFLKPVMRWFSHIAQIKTLPANYTVGYGLTYITEKETKIAVIPQGYSDGYDRGLSNCGEVLIRGKRCKVLGRISMNMMVVDVSHLEFVKVEDEVVLLGKQFDEEITAEEIAEKIGSINYEVTTRVSPLLPRVIV